MLKNDCYFLFVSIFGTFFGKYLWLLLLRNLLLQWFTADFFTQLFTNEGNIFVQICLLQHSYMTEFLDLLTVTL